MIRLWLVVLAVLGAGFGARAQGVGSELDRAVLREGLGQFWGGVLVMKDGEVLLAKGYGLANEELEPISADHLFDLASASKMFTAAAVLRLESQGKLRTTDALNKYFPATGPAGGRITLHHLLTHTSGRSDTNGAIQPLSFEDRDGAVKKFVESRPSGQPGQRFEYCNGGYVVLAAVIEKASGKPFEVAMRELVLKPAGMARSGYLDGAGLDPRKQTLRETSMSGPATRRGPLLDKRLEPWAWGLRGAGGLVTSLNDLAQWERAIRAHQVLDAAATTKWTTVEQGNYACGWMVETEGSGRVRHSHGGATRGYICELVRYPEEGVFIAVLTNERGRPRPVVDAVTRVLWPKEAGGGTVATLEFAPELLSQYMSIVAERGGTVEVTSGDGRTRLTAGDGKRTLATVDMPTAVARGLAGQIRAGLKARDHRRTPRGGIKAGIFGMAHGVTRSTGTLRIEEGSWSVMPGYLGQKPDGSEIHDTRLVLLLTDAAMPGAWPLMIHVDDEVAGRIAGELEGAGE